MLFLIFTEKYTRPDLFGKLNATCFSENEKNIVFINRDLKVECAHSCNENLLQIITNLKDVSVIIVNDIDLDYEDTVLDLMHDTISEHEEIFVLYHANGNITNHTKWIKELSENKLVYEEKDSHVPGSFYHDELFALAKSISRQCNQSYNNAIIEMQNWFIANERNRLKEKLVNISSIDDYQVLELPQLLKEKYISMEKWISFKDEMKKLSLENSKNGNIKKYDVLNKYFNK